MKKNKEVFKIFELKFFWAHVNPPIWRLFKGDSDKTWFTIEQMLGPFSTFIWSCFVVSHSGIVMLSLLIIS